MGYQETYVVMRYGRIKKVAKQLAISFKYQLDFVSVITPNDKDLSCFKDCSKVECLVGGDRHPLADWMVHRYKAKPVEDLEKYLSSKLDKEYGDSHLEDIYTFNS